MHNRLSLFGCVMLVAMTLFASTEPAVALVPGDCGKPTASGIDSDIYPSAVDALAVLKRSVGDPLTPCTDHVCDVNNSGGSILANDGVTSTDALAVLLASNKLPVTLTCAPCISGTSECKQCTDTAFLQILNDDNFTPSLTPAVGVIVNCAAPTIVEVTDTELGANGADGQPKYKFHSNNVWIYAKNLIVERETPCWSQYPICDDSIPGNGTPAITFAGSNSGIARVTIRGFLEGIHFAGQDNTAAGVTLERQCDDSVSNEGSGRGNEVRDSVVMSGCDKCTQDVGDNTNIPGGCNVDTVVVPGAPRNCYHLAYHNVHFNGCGKPVRWNGGGTFLVKDSRVEKTNGMFDCKMLEMGSTPPVRARFQNTLIKNCEGGTIVTGNDAGNRVVFDGNTIQNNQKRGVMIRRSATGTLRRNVIESNGSSGASESDILFRYYGGVSAAGEDGDTPTVNLGAIDDSIGDQPCSVCTTNNPPPEGCNRICSNGGHNNAENAPTFGGGAMQVHNGEAATLIAENNWWCSSAGNGPPTNQLVGMITTPVDVEPALLCDPTD